MTLSFLPAPVLGTVSSVLLILNLVFWFSLLLVVAIMKLLIPIPPVRRIFSRWMSALAGTWIEGNRAIAGLHDIEFDFRGTGQLRDDRWYLVSSNHQNWIDIVVLQFALNRKIPFLKFFIKQKLIWIPLLGFAWWALDMPFMKRHSREEIAKKPELRSQDLEATRKSCEKFRNTPTSVTNFLEGTRFTSAKHAAQESPYKNLLKPKAGGLGFVLATMGDMMTSLLDVTIVYPHRGATFWELLTGRIPKVIVHVQEREIPADLIGGDYLNDDAFRDRLREWVNTLWAEKDARYTELAADL